MEQNKKTEIITKIKIFLFFIYLLVYYMFGADPNKVKYSEIILLIFIALEGIRIIKTKKIKYCIPIIIMFIFAFYCFLSNFWAINAENSINMSKTLFILCAFLLIGYNFFLSINNGEEVLLKLLIGAGFFFSLYVIMYYGIGNYFTRLMNGERMGAEINNVNAIGMQIVIPFIICIYYVIYDNKKKYIFFLSIIPLIVSLGTGSREVLIAIISGIILLVLLKNNEKFTINSTIKKFFIIVLIIVLFIQVSKVPIFSNIFDRFESMTNFITKKGKVDGSTNLRYIYIQAGVEQFTKNPILGVGISNSGYITMKVANRYTYLHNNFLELLACAGIIGFTLYYSVFVYCIYYCIKFLKRKNKFIYLTLIILIITLLMDYGTVSYYDKAVYVYLMYGLITVEREKKKIIKEGRKNSDEFQN